jgi:putative MFS transporter
MMWQTPTACRSVQQYIDELPMWADGTHLPSAPMTGMQWLIWSLAAAGKFFEGFVVFMTGVALPLMSREFGIGAAENGIISAASLFGILVGAVGLGGMSDRFGRKPMFIVEMIIFAAFLVLLIFCTNFVFLVICLFGIGLALGCDYPTAHMIISESIPEHQPRQAGARRLRFQAVGALGGTASASSCCRHCPNLGAWRWMYAPAIIPAVLVTIGRFYIVESARLAVISRGADRQGGSGGETRCSCASRNIRPRSRCRAKSMKAAANKSNGSFLALFNKRNRRATILASVPWFLQDLGTYGIGIFTPTILGAAVGAKLRSRPQRRRPDRQRHLAAKGAALITSC